MDHDRLFKELLTSFFFEFLDLFFPEISGLIERSQPPIFLDKEVFGELASDKRRELEPQAQWIEEFPEKMFRYFAKLWDRHGLRVYPIAILSFEAPRDPQESHLGMRFPGLYVLDFRFSVVQLNRLDWRAFVDKPNPVASALMARMNFRPEERPRVKLQCLRLLATLRLEPVRLALISRFVDSYLNLQPEEIRIFDQFLETIPEVEKHEVMEITTSWQRQGRVEGLRQGLTSGLQVLFGTSAKA